MKPYIQYLLTVCAAIWVSSCSFLDENMNTHYSDEDIYGSESALEAAVTGCYYSYANSGFYNGAMMEWLAPASALVHWGMTNTPLTDPQKRWLDCLSLTNFSKNPSLLNMYKGLYGTVYKCNKLISALPGSPVDEAFKRNIEAEARFVRAQAYFHLVRRWGDVPVHLDVPTTIDQTNGKRQPFWKVYQIILSDLEYAYENGRSWDEQLKYGIGTGRICSHGARASQSLVYLTIGTLLAHSEPGDNFWVCSNEEVFKGFAEMGIESADDAFRLALEAAKDVMPETSTTGSPYRLADSYAQLFRFSDPEDFRLRERIFVVTSVNEKANSQLATWTLPNYYNNTPNNIFYGRFRPSRFLFQKWCETYGRVNGSGNAANIYVKSGDPRMDAALVYESFIGQNGATKYCYPNANCIYNTDRWMAMPYFKKYYDPKYANTAGYADLYMMRLAEVYLIAAEACANLCTTPGDAMGQEAMSYVNILLARARRSTADGTEATQPADWTSAGIDDNSAGIKNKDELIERIFWERAFEMTGEQHEYFDTHRMGAKWLAEHVTKPANDFLDQPEQGDYNGKDGFKKLYYGYGGHSGDKVYPELQSEVRKGLICPIPNDELVYNSALTLDDQNPAEIFWE